MNIQQSAVRKSTRAEVLLNEIEQMIVDGILLPGEKLDETALANMFGVSRTPVREAIRALTAIGLAIKSLESPHLGALRLWVRIA